MNLRQALAAIRAAGITARLQLADDPEDEDDEIVLSETPAVAVQVSATRDGLRYSGTVESGSGDDWGVTFGEMRADPVSAARDALRIAGLPQP